MSTRWEHIVQVSEVHHGGSHVPRRARPPWTFFNDVITACGWSTKVAELERYLLGGRIKGPPGAIALILGRQRGLAASSEPRAKNTPRNSQREDAVRALSGGPEGSQPAASGVFPLEKKSDVSCRVY